jgi:hypothetical protein
MINTSNDVDFNRIMNLIRFNVNFSKYVSNSILLHQSPSYILEKYNYWIGYVTPIENMYIPKKMDSFFWEYTKKWGRDYRKVKSQLIYLKSTENIEIVNMVSKFEEHIGPIRIINRAAKIGLHEKTEIEFIPEILKKNKDNLSTILRDIKLKKLV